MLLRGENGIFDSLSILTHSLDNQGCHCIVWESTDSWQPWFGSDFNGKVIGEYKNNGKTKKRECFFLNLCMSLTYHQVEYSHSKEVRKEGSSSKTTTKLLELNSILDEDDCMTVWPSKWRASFLTRQKRRHVDDSSHASHTLTHTHTSHAPVRSRKTVRFSAVQMHGFKEDWLRSPPPFRVKEEEFWKSDVVNNLLMAFKAKNTLFLRLDYSCWWRSTRAEKEKESVSGAKIIGFFILLLFFSCCCLPGKCKQ